MSKIDELLKFNRLFLLKTRGVGSFYIVAKSMDDAENLLWRLLSEADYGFDSERIVEHIDIVTNELIRDFRDEIYFDDDNRLILSENWKEEDMK